MICRMSEIENYKLIIQTQYLRENNHPDSKLEWKLAINSSNFWWTASLQYYSLHSPPLLVMSSYPPSIPLPYTTIAFTPLSLSLLFPSQPHLSCWIRRFEAGTPQWRTPSTWLFLWAARCPQTVLRVWWGTCPAPRDGSEGVRAW